MKILDIYNFYTFCDVAQPWQLGLQSPATPIAEGMIAFHGYLMFFLIVIGVFVLWMLYQIIIHFNEDVNPISQKFTHSSLLEIVWTIVPAIVLLFIAIPSFALLYSLDEIIDPVLTLKVIGHQWYWSYEYSDFDATAGGISETDLKLFEQVDTNINFDSYMVPTNDLIPGSFRLLETDNRVTLPIKTHIRVLVTSADVIHSWAVPSFGVKIDATPGRLSQVSLFIKRKGVYYGQCSEICGVNHGFMPIVVVGVSSSKFTEWVSFIIFNKLAEVVDKDLALLNTLVDNAVTPEDYSTSEITKLSEVLKQRTKAITSVNLVK
jgi:cytochrome c oxidase subunit 2